MAKTSHLLTSPVVEKRQISRSSNSAMVTHRHLERRDKKPSEVPSTRVAIQNFCRSCIGYEPDDGKTLAKSVEDCRSYTCWLWNYRTGKVSPPPIVLEDS